MNRPHKTGWRSATLALLATLVCTLAQAVPGWAEAQQQQFRERLRGAGFAAEFEEGRLTVTRAAT